MFAIARVTRKTLAGECRLQIDALRMRVTRVIPRTVIHSFSFVFMGLLFRWVNCG